MMTLEILAAEIKHLPIDTRLGLIQIIISSVKEELVTQSPRTIDLEHITGIISPEDAQQMLAAIEEECERVVDTKPLKESQL